MATYGIVPLWHLTKTVIPSGIALVAGGARGLGLAVALSFAREGCSGVAILDVLPDEELKKAEANVMNEGADVSLVLK